MSSVGSVPIASSAPSLPPDTKTAGVKEDMRQRAIQALGTPILENDREVEIDKAIRDGKIDATELRTIWGIGQEQLVGLTSYGVSCDGKGGQDDGLTITDDGNDEIGTLITHKKEVELHRFQRIMSGTREDPATLEELFNKLYSLAFQGKLDREAWNGLMMEYHFPSFKMNVISFKYLLGDRDGGNENGRVEGFTEFSTALYNIERTLQSQIPPSQVHSEDGRRDDYPFADQDPNAPDADVERFYQYEQLFAKYCDARYFHNQDAGAFDRMVRGSFEQGAREGYVMPRTNEALFLAIQAGDFDNASGYKLSEMVEKYDIQSWEALTLYLQYLMQKGIEQDANRSDDYTRNNNMKAKHTRRIWSLIDDGADGKMKNKTQKRYQALQAQMQAVILDDSKLVHYEAIRLADKPDKTKGGDE